MCGVEIKIQFMRRDGTESWVAISREIEKYVVECTVTPAIAERNEGFPSGFFRFFHFSIFPFFIFETFFHF